jgi:hypothetical protein
MKLKNSVTHSSVPQVLHFAVKEHSAAQLCRHIRRIGMVLKKWQWIRRGSGLRLCQIVVRLSEWGRKFVPKAFRKRVEWVTTMRLESCKQRKQYRYFQNAVHSFTSSV